METCIYHEKQIDLQEQKIETSSGEALLDVQYHKMGMNKIHILTIEQTQKARLNSCGYVKQRIGN